MRKILIISLFLISLNCLASTQPSHNLDSIILNSAQINTTPAIGNSAYPIVYGGKDIDSHIATAKELNWTGLPTFIA